MKGLCKYHNFRASPLDSSIMSHPQDIIRLYSTILFHDIRRHAVSDDDMKAAIADMQRVYKPEPGSLSSTVRRLANYNSMVYRCAYLHKYAPFHTAMVCDIMRCILQQKDNMFFAFQKRFTKRQKFKICSLGGGPGSDTVGVLVAMFEYFGLFPCSAKVIDMKSDWKDTLSSVINGLRSGMCGPIGECFTQRFFNWEYLTADLLEEVQDDVKSAIGSAELVTMVKFVSAAACESTEWMLKKIFTLLKLGAVVLFIDNSAGGFRQLVSKAATDCNLTSVYGPINYQLYTNEAFNITHWDHTSCYSTTVTIHMMQKLHPSPPSINTSNKTLDLAPISNNKLSDKCSTGTNILNIIPAPSSNVNSIIKERPTVSSNGDSLRNKFPPSSSKNIIHKELLTPSNCTSAIDKELPISSSPIQKELPISSSPIQNELPIANSHSISIQNELASIYKHDNTIRNELPSDKHGNATKTTFESKNIIQIKNNDTFPIRESSESECTPSTHINGLHATKVSIMKETQNSDSCLTLSSKTDDNGHPISSNDLSCAIVDSESKKQQKANRRNQRDFNEFTINEDCLLIPLASNNGVCAIEVSYLRDSFNSGGCEETCPDSASVQKESSEQVSADKKPHESESGCVAYDMGLEVSDLEENDQVKESVEKLISTKSLQTKTCTSPSNDTIFKFSFCTLL